MYVLCTSLFISEMFEMVGKHQAISKSHLTVCTEKNKVPALLIILILIVHGGEIQDLEVVTGGGLDEGTLSEVDQSLMGGGTMELEDGGGGEGITLGSGAVGEDVLVLVILIVILLLLLSAVHPVLVFICALVLVLRIFRQLAQQIPSTVLESDPLDGTLIPPVLPPLKAAPVRPVRRIQVSQHRHVQRAHGLERREIRPVERGEVPVVRPADQVRAEQLNGRVRRCIPDPERVQQPVAADVGDVVVREVDERRRRGPPPTDPVGLVARGEAPVEVECERREARAEVEDLGTSRGGMHKRSRYSRDDPCAVRKAMASGWSTQLLLELNDGLRSAGMLHPMACSTNSWKKPPRESC